MYIKDKQMLVFHFIYDLLPTGRGASVCSLAFLGSMSQNRSRKLIVIQAGEAAKIFNIMKENIDNEVDKDVQPKDWLHPADAVRITEIPEDDEIKIYTDGSKNDNGVGAGIAIVIEGKLEQQLKYKLHNNCSNNQAEQLAIEEQQ
jgi:hypothetical protein